MGWHAATRRGLWAAACLLLAALWLFPGRPALVGDAGGIVFIGDSITHQGDWPRLLGCADVDNQVVDGDTSAGVLDRARLSGVVAKHSAKTFLMIGINDLRRGGGKPEAAEGLLVNHERILGRLRANCPRPKSTSRASCPFRAAFSASCPTTASSARSISV